MLRWGGAILTFVIVALLLNLWTPLASPLLNPPLNTNTSTSKLSAPAPHSILETEQRPCTPANAASESEGADEPDEEDDDDPCSTGLHASARKLADGWLLDDDTLSYASIYMKQAERPPRA